MWSNLPQKFFDLVKSLIFYGSSKCVKMPPFWFTTEFDGEWVEGRMLRHIENTMILRFAYLLVSVGKAGKVVRKKMLARCAVVGCSNTTKLTGGTPLHAILFYGEMIVVKRRNAQSDGSISWKRNVQSDSRLRVR